MKSILMTLTMMLVGLSWSTSSMADDVSFVGSAPASVGLGVRFQMSYEVNDRASDIILPDVDGLEVIMGPSVSSSSSFSVVNGQATSSRKTIFTYVVVGRKEGTFTVPAAKVEVGGKSYSSNSLVITVVKGMSGSSPAASSSSGQSAGSSSFAQSGTVSSGSDIIVTQTLSKQSTYEGQGVELVTKIYTRVALNSISGVQNPKLSEFVVTDKSPQQLDFHTELLDGVQYEAAEFSRKVLIPQKSGKITIEPIEIEFVVKKRSSRRRGSIFDDFFDDIQLVRQKATSKSLTLNVKALPDKPAGFSGGVGSFRFNVSVSPTEVDVDNSVQVKVSVEGEGNLKLLSMPKPQFHQDFDAFDPSTKSNMSPVVQGFKGTRSDEYLIIPRRDGEFEIPQLRFVYFDTQKGQYVTQTQGPFSIKVNKGEGGSRTNGTGGGVAMHGAGPEQVTYTGQDLRYLHRSKALKSKDDFFVLSPLFWGLTLVPLAALVGLFFVYRKKVKDNANIGLVRRRKANKVAQKRLKQAAKFIKENKREAFFDEVMRALWGYLSDKLTMPLSILTKDNAKEKMSEHGIEQEASDEFMSLLDECEFARYAPADISSTMEDVFAKATEVIERIENNSRK